jgi:hypothetical protein
MRRQGMPLSSADALLVILVIGGALALVFHLS